MVQSHDAVSYIAPYCPWYSHMMPFPILLHTVTYLLTITPIGCGKKQHSWNRSLIQFLFTAFPVGLTSARECLIVCALPTERNTHSDTATSILLLIHLSLSPFPPSRASLSSPLVSSPTACSSTPWGAPSWVSYWSSISLLSKPCFRQRHCREATFSSSQL